MLKRLLLGLLVLASATACYRMPDEDEIVTIPLTNNPAVTKEPPARLVPGVNY
jgi:hypothetical protein